MRSASATSTASPAWWPSESLTALNPSRSSTSRHSGVPWRSARAVSAASRSWKARWLASPVSESVAARVASRLRSSALEIARAIRSANPVRQRTAIGQGSPGSPVAATTVPHRRALTRMGAARSPRRPSWARPRANGSSIPRQVGVEGDGLGAEDPRDGAGAGRRQAGRVAVGLGQARGRSPRADHHRAVALEAQHPGGGVPEQAGHLAGHQVEDRLGVLALGDRGRHAAERCVLGPAAGDGVVERPHLLRERVHGVLQQVPVLVHLEVRPLDAREEVAPRRGVGRRALGVEAGLAQLPRQQAVHHASARVVMLMVWLWSSGRPRASGPISP